MFQGTQELLTADNFCLLTSGFETVTRRRKQFDCNCLTEKENYLKNVSLYLKTEILLNRRVSTVSNMVMCLIAYV